MTLEQWPDYCIFCKGPCRQPEEFRNAWKSIPKAKWDKDMFKEIRDKHKK